MERRGTEGEGRANSDLEVDRDGRGSEGRPALFDPEVPRIQFNPRKHSFPASMALPRSRVSPSGSLKTLLVMIRH